VFVSHPQAALNYTFIEAPERVKNMRRRRFPRQPLDIGQLAVALNKALGEKGIDPAVTTSFMRTLYDN